ncbi:MAG: hypothetical protein BKP49_08780 [Treponema sp. CETP13]|nr:MAG: hypothetical protein BKP49_08780 [Treponema sp. CETP13]
MNILLAALWSAGASACFSVCLNAFHRDILFCALLGSIGWILYLSIFGLTGSLFGGYFTGAFTVSIVAEILASYQKKPATIFILPGLLPLVPGGGMFNTMEAALTGNLTKAGTLGYQTLGEAGAIALGIALASSSARIIRRIRIKTR